MSQELAVTLGQWLDEFLDDMRRRNYSPRTQRGYRYDLLLFVAWLAEQEDVSAPGHLVPAVLERYQMHLMLRPSISVACQALSFNRRFYRGLPRWLQRRPWPGSSCGPKGNAMQTAA